jgi:hypothetical protein
LTKKKIYKETLGLNDIIDQMDLANIYRAFHLAVTQYTFFSAAHRTFSKTDHILKHKLVLTNIRKTEIRPCRLSGHK